MRMRQRHRIKPLYSSRPQIRRHRFFSGVRPRNLFAPTKSRKSSPAVNQQRAPPRRNHQDRVPLRHVQYIHLQRPSFHRSREGISRNHQRSRQQSHHRRPLHPPPQDSFRAQFRCQQRSANKKQNGDPHRRTRDAVAPMRESRKPPNNVPLQRHQPPKRPSQHSCDRRNNHRPTQRKKSQRHNHTRHWHRKQIRQRPHHRNPVKIPRHQRQHPKLQHHR